MTAVRYKALDVFRGLTVCVMIVVNTAGAGAEPFATLQHAKWFGFTLADAVFPSFLFAIGNAMCFAMKPGVPNSDFFGRVLKRAGLIFLLGYLMYWYPFGHQQPDGSWAFNPIGETRIMGVLQRIALCYAAAAIACRFLSVKYLIALCVLLLGGYWSILLTFGVRGQELTALGNAGAMVDQAVLGIDHMYRKGHGYDPEGLLSTLPAIVNVIAGYLAGLYIVRGKDKPRLIRNLMICGVVVILASMAWSVAFPIAKRIWTSSFVLLTVGIDLILLAILIAYIDLAGRTEGTRFFEIFGKNPLVIYLFSELLVTTLQMIKVNGEGLYDWIGVHLFQAVLPGAIGSLACAFVYMLVCWGVGYAMDRRNIIVKL